MTFLTVYLMLGCTHQAWVLSVWTNKYQLRARSVIIGTCLSILCWPVVVGLTLMTLLKSR